MYRYLPRSIRYVTDYFPYEFIRDPKQSDLSPADVAIFFKQKKRYHLLINWCDWLATIGYCWDQVETWVLERVNISIHPTLWLLRLYLHLPGLFIHELAHYLSDVLLGSWGGCYPIKFSVYHTESNVGGSVQPQLASRPSSVTYEIALSILSFQAPTLVWLAGLWGSLTLVFPYNGIGFTAVVLFMNPQSWGDTRRVHNIITNLLHTIPPLSFIRSRENELPVWQLAIALVNLTYRVLGWPAFYLKLIITGLMFLCVPLIRPNAHSLLFSYTVEMTSARDKLTDVNERNKNYRCVTSLTSSVRYRGHEKFYQKFLSLWILSCRLCLLLAQAGVWLFVAGLAILMAQRGSYLLLCYWILYGHFILGRPTVRSQSMLSICRLLYRVGRREHFRAKINELVLAHQQTVIYQTASNAVRVTRRYGT